MPLYDYKCREHGLFHELATMDRAALPCACPQCGKPSARVLMIPPEVLRMAPKRRQVQARNEQAAHAPRLSTTDSRADLAARQRHEMNKRSCACPGHQAEAGNPDRSALRQQAIYLPDGSKVFPSQRPWMISH